MKVLILVLSHNTRQDYKDLFINQKKTWDFEKIDNVETYYYFGDSDENKIIGNEIHVSITESETNIGHKTIQAFEMIKNMDYDFIFRTNSGSYVDKKLLLNFIETMPKNKFYCGVLGYLHNIQFVSGSGYFLSKDLVDIVIENKSKWNHNYIDDVALGLFLYENKISPKKIDSTEFNHSLRYDCTSGGLVDFNIPLHYYHYRLRNSNRELDVMNMNLIEQLKQKNK